jgi:hypothetical protein
VNTTVLSSFQSQDTCVHVKEGGGGEAGITWRETWREMVGQWKGDGGVSLGGGAGQGVWNGARGRGKPCVNQAGGSGGECLQVEG